MQLAIQNNVIINAAHIIGPLNTVTNNLSRIKVNPLEWILNNSVTRGLSQVLASPIIDLSSRK